MGQIHLLTLESLLERQEVTAAPPGKTDTGNSHFGSSSYRGDTGKHHSGILPPVSEHWNLALSTSLLALVLG